MNAETYLDGIAKQFKYYKVISEKAIHQLDEKQLFYQPSQESNSIAIIVKHMAGNMISRFTDFLTTDGEKAWRKRDTEFYDDVKSKKLLMDYWEKGWDQVFFALEAINETNFNQLVYIRNEGHTIPEAFNRQLGHYAYHSGQIIFIAKMLADSKWNTLSIPKNGSEDYFKEKFSQPKRRSHYTEGLDQERKDQSI